MAVRSPATASLPLLAVHLHAADLHAKVARRNQQLVVNRHPTRDQRAGHDRAEAFHGEDAVDWQPRDAVGRAAARLAAHRDQRRPQLVEPLAGLRRHRHDRRAVEQRPGDQLAHLHLDEFEGIGVDQVGLGQRDHPGRHAQQAADVEVLARLRHHRLVGRDDQHDEIDAAGAGEHVLHEALVAGDVDEREVDVVDRLMGEAEVDGDAARLLFLEAIRVGPRQRQHERALAVIDVPGGADDDRPQSGGDHSGYREHRVIKATETPRHGEPDASPAAQRRQRS